MLNRNAKEKNQEPVWAPQGDPTVLILSLSHPGDTPLDTPVKVTLPAVAGPRAESWTE